MHLLLGSKWQCSDNKFTRIWSDTCVIPNCIGASGLGRSTGFGKTRGFSGTAGFLSGNGGLADLLESFCSVTMATGSVGSGSFGIWSCWPCVGELGLDAFLGELTGESFVGDAAGDLPLSGEEICERAVSGTGKSRDGTASVGDGGAGMFWSVSTR